MSILTTAGIIMAKSKRSSKAELPKGTEALLKKGIPLRKAINIAGLKKTKKK